MGLINHPLFVHIGELLSDPEIGAIGISRDGEVCSATIDRMAFRGYHDAEKAHDEMHLTPEQVKEYVQMFIETGEFIHHGGFFGAGAEAKMAYIGGGSITILPDGPGFNPVFEAIMIYKAAQNIIIKPPTI